MFFPPEARSTQSAPIQRAAHGRHLPVARVCSAMVDSRGCLEGHDAIGDDNPDAQSPTRNYLLIERTSRVRAPAGNGGKTTGSPTPFPVHRRSSAGGRVTPPQGSGSRERPVLRAAGAAALLNGYLTLLVSMFMHGAEPHSWKQLISGAS